MKLRAIKFRDLDIKTKLGSILILFTLVALFNYLSVSYFKSQQENDAAIVDAAGRQRMLSQRMAFFAEMISCGKEQAREGLREVTDLHDVSLNSLKMGGVVPGIGNGKPVPPTKPIIMPTLLEAEALWKVYKQNAEIILSAPLFVDSTKIIESVDTAGMIIRSQHMYRALNPDVAGAITFIEENATEMLIRNNALVIEYFIDCERKHLNLNYLLMFLLAINAVLIVAGFYNIEKYVVKPAKLIRHGAQRLAQGDLSQKIEYKSEDEMGYTVQDLNTLSDNLEGAAQFAQAIEEGSFKSDYQAVSNQDKLGMALINMRDQLLKVSQEDKKRTWISDGLTQFGDILRGDQSNAQVLAQKVITHLVKYLEANQGALFIVNDDDKEDIHLELLSVYAWGKQKFIDKKIEKGEGVAGTVWREGEIVYLTEVPDDYVQITSGLGKANPRSILVVPLKLEEEVLGIIEIASFKVYEDYQLEFIQKLSENLGSTMATSKINSRTKLLLEQTQQQAEEMRAQEEEMRQNMEELSATQEEMMRKEQEYIQKIQDLEAKLNETETYTEQHEV